jgi:hypothetical protein
MLTQQTQSARTPLLPAWLDPRAALRRAYAINRPLTLLGVLMLVSLAVSAGGLLLDPRVITGAPAWLKPAKFSISIVLYAFTLLWMLTFVEGHPRWVRAISVVSLVAFIVEMVAVITQVLRGTISHFNAATPFDIALFNVMGSFVMVIWLMNLAAAVLLLRQRLPDPAVAWSLRLGLLITLIGGALGFLMTSPTPAQLDAMRAGLPAAVIGAHSVGVADGGAGLPITGWSTVGGDLRIGHFIGLHALQMLPIVGWLLARRSAARRLRPGQRLALVWIAGASYLGLIALVTWQALRGQPLIAPDATTLLAAGAWLAATLLAAGAVFVRGQSAAE